MLRMALGAAAMACTGAMAAAQTNGLAPENLPPESFDGREFVDSAGCTFLRSTFGGEVVWVPRYGDDREPVCGRTPTDFAAAQTQNDAAAQGDMASSSESGTVQGDTPEQASDTTAQDGATAVEAAAEDRATLQDGQDAGAPDTDSADRARTRIEVVDRATSSTVPDAPTTTKEPARVPAPARHRRAALRGADASGRHPSCPAHAPYGQLVDTVQGRKMVRCVTSPARFLADTSLGQASTAPRTHRATAPAHGARVQVGSFAVPANAHRLQNRLRARGLPARIGHVRGLRVVTVGPLAGAHAARRALATVRAMGFHDAFLRR